LKKRKFGKEFRNYNLYFKLKFNRIKYQDIGENEEDLGSVAVVSPQLGVYSFE